MGAATTLTTTITGGSIVSYEWTFGNGAIGNGPLASHTYPGGGLYTAVVTASNGVNALTTTTPITIVVVDFVASPRFGGAPLTVTFTNTSQNLSGAATYLWRFGDGATSATTHPTHTYTQTGLYTVSLRVTDGAFTHVQTKTHYISVGDARVIEYEYDGLYRLVEADYASGEHFAYTYDAVGNRTTYTATITQTTVITYKYPSATLRTGDAADRLVRVGDVDETWDNLGRLLDDGIYTYTWDAAGRLITVSAGVDVLGFRYDSASQHRIRRKSTMRKKISLTIGLVIVLGVVGLATYFLRSDSPPPPTTEEIISQVLRSELPEFIRGKTGYARSGDVNIWYESIKPHGAAKGAVLILAGISSDALMWSPRFLDALGDAGYQVIRYDYRGTGMSDWIKDWDSRNPYSIQDMVNDGIAVLDAMGIKEAHVVGVSMGGMVAQQMAIDHPDRVLSLTSIMSSGDIADPNLPSTPADVVQEFLAISMEFFATKSERNAIESHIAFRTILMGDSSYALDVKTISEQVLYNLRKRQGYNLQAYLQHQTAVLTSGSRYDELQTIDTPTLIIHGKSDPLIPIEHGMKCADLIPHADTLWIDGLGHDLPDKYVDVIVEKMVMNFQRAE